MNVKELLNSLDKEFPLSNAMFKYALEQTEIKMEDVEEFIEFGNFTYKRNFMHHGNGYDALILCWGNGQRSPIHDHKGSRCGVKVICGTATETVFKWSPNKLLFPTTSIEYESGKLGESVVSEDEDIHQISNLQPYPEQLITLHIYSPPLLRMNTYSLGDSKATEYIEPIYLSGAGI